MAFRGRGRGRGGGGSFQYAKQEPFELFPENVTLPNVSDIPEAKGLVICNSRLLNYWKASPFYLEENVMKKMQKTEIERFSDRTKSNSTLKRDSLAQILQLTSRNFPEELVEGFKGKLRSKRKVQWNPESGLTKLDFLEKREESLKGQNKDDKEKKEGEGEEDEDEEDDDAQSEELTDDDYYQVLTGTVGFCYMVNLHLRSNIHFSCFMCTLTSLNFLIFTLENFLMLTSLSCRTNISTTMKMITTWKRKAEMNQNINDHGKW